MSGNNLLKIHVLFGEHHLEVSHKENQNAFIRCIDYRVSEIALKIIKYTALTIAAVITIGSIVFSEIGLPFYLVVSALALIALGSHSMIASFHRYYDQKTLESYKQEALTLCRSYKDLDSHSGIGGDNKEKAARIKKNVVKPLTALIKRHHSIDVLLKYEILSPESLIELFLLESQYKSFPESFKFYQEVKRSIEKTKYPEKYEESWNTAVNPKMNDQFKIYLSSQLNLLNTPDSYDEFTEWKLAAKEFTEVLKSVKETPAINLPDHLKEMVNRCSKDYEEALLQYQIGSAKEDKPITKHKMHLEKTLESLERKYKGLELHNFMDKKQKEFIESIQLIQETSEAKRSEVADRAAAWTNAIAARSQEESDLLKYNAQRLRKENQEIENQIKGEISRLADRIVSKDLEKANQDLLSYKNDLNQKKEKAISEYKDDLDFSDQKESFMRSYHELITKINAPIQELKDALAFLIAPESEDDEFFDASDFPDQAEASVV